MKGCDRLQDRQLIHLLVERDGTGCWYCGMPLDFKFDITREHLIPWSAGGRNALWNLALAHGRCNRAGANLRFTEKLVLRDMIRAGCPIRGGARIGNSQTRARNRRFEKRRRRGTLPLTATLQTITRARSCGVCGKITAKTLATRKTLDATCASCVHWAATQLAPAHHVPRPRPAESAVAATPFPLSGL
jgi:hypothetical protein